MTRAGRTPGARRGSSASTLRAEAGQGERTAPRLVVFDVDGTLVDSQHVILDAMTQAFAGVGAPDAGARGVLGVVGLSLPEAMAALAPHLPETDTLRLADALPRPLRRAARRRRRRGARAALPRRARGARAARRPARDAARGRHRQGPPRPRPRLRRPRPRAASSSPPRPPTTTPRSRIPRCCSPRSPRPAARPGAAVMVGDTEFDMAMGRAAGLATVGVSLGLPSARPAGRRRRRRRHRRLRRARRRARPARERRMTGWARAPALLARRERPSRGRRLRRRPRRPARCAPRAGSPLVAADRGARRARSPPSGRRSGTRSTPTRLPLTRAANSAIDRVAAQREAVIDAIAEYGGYRPALLPRRRAGGARGAAGRRLGPVARLGARDARRAARRGHRA